MMLFGLEWLRPEFFLLLPLLILPWLQRSQGLRVGWLALAVVDPVSRLLNQFVKCLAALVWLACVCVLADPHRPEQRIRTVGSGAEVVILLDRSRSMDELFNADLRNVYNPNRRETDTRRRTARNFLNTFVQRRPDDRFGFVLFSTGAIDLLPLTANREAIHATIDASALGRGLAETNIAQGLLSAAKMFSTQRYRGARIVLLVSDGGSQISEVVKKKIKRVFQEQNLAIYWIYIRTTKGMSLEEKPDDSPVWIDSPERSLHAFFRSLPLAYKVYEAESIAGFAEAMAAIHQEQSQPIEVEKVVAHEKRNHWFLLIAAGAAFLLWIFECFNVRTLHGSERWQAQLHGRQPRRTGEQW